ncbi:MAG: rRNA methyltransferase [Deltaproteobacteria bacterium]|nr:rRNA methyltransferase [Deltaproteobacteria bacterium]
MLRTQLPANLGAAARAMKNFGLSRLTLVAPRTSDLPAARAVAVHAEDIIDRARIVASLADALADARWIVGTTNRPIAGQRQLAPPAFAEEAAARSHEGEVALLFGDEQSGLSNADLLACHDASTIPTEKEQPSLNLAQAVVVYANALFGHAAAPPPPEREARATEKSLSEVERALRDLLHASKFPDPDRPGHGVAKLSQTLRRSGLTDAEARLWQAALRQVEQRLIRKS